MDLKSQQQVNVHEHLNKTATQIREEIKNAVKGRGLSVQLDIATRLNRSIFGIDIQYIANKEVVIHNIGMIELEKAHTSNYLSQVYRQCLDRYGIAKQQILSISGDNGKKFIRIEQEYSTAKETAKPNAKRRLDFSTENVLPQREMEIDEEIETVLGTREILEDDIAILDGIFNECNIDLEVLPEQQIILDDTIEEIEIEIENENLFMWCQLRRAHSSIGC